ncbi:hypothetical protein [Alteromonas sp. A079]|uniref:hypothetical protein n=1 Tax=Alteromonas sp. A079 TaxID=3410268 RepID=UPI003BA1F085
MMRNNEQLLIGQVLQIKDKLSAKRHNIPETLQTEWQHLNARTECFEVDALYNQAVKGERMRKHVEFDGNTKELTQIVNRLTELNDAVCNKALRH